MTHTALKDILYLSHLKTVAIEVFKVLHNMSSFYMKSLFSKTDSPRYCYPVCPNANLGNLQFGDFIQVYTDTFISTDNLALYVRMVHNLCLHCSLHTHSL